VYLQNLEHTTGLQLRDPSGEVRTEFANPYPFDALSELGSAPSLREAGPLDDLGAAELYYINLSDHVLTEMDDFLAALHDAEGYEGLVLDLRGYPRIDHYEIARRLIPQSFHSPIFRTPVITAHGREVQENQYTLQPLADPAFHGPLILLVGPGSVSAAENLATMLVDADRATVIGLRSAGTNGNITGVQIPGRFGFTFTGMEVLHADGSTFHGQGIAPDVEVWPTVADLAAERDPALEKAIEVLQGT
jgi:C-terminal processing protease CtpA/Prc